MTPTEYQYLFDALKVKVVRRHQTNDGILQIVVATSGAAEFGHAALLKQDGEFVREYPEHPIARAALSGLPRPRRGS